MTLLVAWVSRDDKPGGKQTSAMYIGSDSRYSWSTQSNKFDHGQKTYACVTHPDIFGFYGDVTFCTMVITNLKTLIDSNCLFREEYSIDDKLSKVFEKVSSIFDNYPKMGLQESCILHGTRVGNEFALNVIKSSKDDTLSSERADMPEHSDLIFTGGSGETEFNGLWSSHDVEKMNNRHTSRNVFHCLVETVTAANLKKHPTTGGHPQIVGLYRGGNARVFGVVHEGKRVVAGTEVEQAPYLKNIEWRNANFERTDADTLKTVAGGQRHYF